MHHVNIDKVMVEICGTFPNLAKYKSRRSVGAIFYAFSGIAQNMAINTKSIYDWISLAEKDKEMKHSIFRAMEQVQRRNIVIGGQHFSTLIAEFEPLVRDNILNIIPFLTETKQTFDIDLDIFLTLTDSIMLKMERDENVEHLIPYLKEASRTFRNNLYHFATHAFAMAGKLSRQSNNP